MKTRSLFIIFVTFNALAIYNCFSMQLEKEDKIITLDKGLLTVIPAKIIQQGYKQTGFFETTPFIAAIDEREDSLINLWGYANNSAYFRPLIMQVIIRQPNSLIKNHGTYYKLPREVKEAIREKQALYYTRKQGILIYSLDQQPDPSIVTHIDYMLENDKREMTISHS